MVFIKSLRLSPRESDFPGEVFLMSLGASDIVSEAIIIDAYYYQAPVLRPLYFGARRIARIEVGKQGNTVLTLPIIPIPGIQTNIIASILDAKTVESSHKPSKPVQFSSNQALSWLQPKEDDDPPKTMVLAPTVEPEALEQRHSPFIFTVALANPLKEETVIVTYMIEQQEKKLFLVNATTVFETFGSLMFNPGETAKTVHYSPPFLPLDATKQKVFFRITGANNGQYPYWPIPVVARILPFILIMPPTAVEVYVEDGTRAQFKIELNAPAEFPITVKFKLEGTAQAGVDYFPPGKTFAFPAEQQIVTLDIKLKKTEANFDRSLTLKLISADSKGEAGEITGLPTGAGVVIKKAVEV